jgi:type I restriction enzyme S subunit
MGEFKPYEEYIEVDLPWLERIPSHWGQRKVKYLFDERVEKGYPDETLLAATQNKGVVPKHMYENRTVVAQKDLHLLKLVKKGDFVISLRSFQGGIEYAYYQGIISPAYTIMIPKSEIAPGFFKHLGKSRLFIELLKFCVTGIREGQNIDYNVLKNSMIPLPPKEEQDQIAKFLDNRLSKINRFIKAKKKQIELLKELKQAIINQTVTKGIDPSVPMKDSGVEWLGEIPEHWGQRKVKYLFDERVEKGYPDETLLAATQNKGVVPKHMYENRTVVAQKDLHLLKLVKKGDFVISLRSF